MYDGDVVAQWVVLDLGDRCRYGLVELLDSRLIDIARKVVERVFEGQNFFEAIIEELCLRD